MISTISNLTAMFWVVNSCKSLKVLASFGITVMACVRSDEQPRLKVAVAVQPDYEYSIFRLFVAIDEGSRLPLSYIARRSVVIVVVLVCVVVVVSFTSIAR